VRNPAPIYKTPTFEPMRGSAVSTRLEPHQTVNKSSSIMDDVTFIRLPEVKAVTGLSRACPPRTARSRLGEIRDQAMGRRTRTGIAFCCLTPLRAAMGSPALADRDACRGNPPGPAL
jgi:hypothetical protein